MTDEESITKAGVLTELDHEWSVLQAFIATLTDAQMTVPTDDAGWTVKDHLIHLVLWLYNVPAIIDGASRPEAMGISEEKFREGADAIVIDMHGEATSEKQALGCLVDGRASMVMTSPAIRAHARRRRESRARWRTAPARRAGRRRGPCR